jgi:hypothetical protein
VLVDGFREEVDELERLAAECYVLGIYPIVKLSLSNPSLEYLADNEAPEDIEAKHLMALVDGLDAWITVFGWGKEGEEKRVYPPEYQPSGKVFEKMGRKRVKFIMVTLPPPEGHPLRDALRNAFECDYDQLRSSGRTLRTALKGAEDICIRTKHGTDLTFSVKDRPILVEDGVLDDEDLRENFTLALPSGVVSLFPVEATVNGTAFVKKAREYRYGGGDVEDATLQFEDGRLVDWKATKGTDVIRRFLEKTSGTSDIFCEVCLGINEKVDHYVGLPNIDELRYGAADIAIGHNRPFGISSTAPPVHWHFSLGRISLNVGEETAIADGAICARLGSS